jgi:hypothetical protein
MMFLSTQDRVVGCRIKGYYLFQWVRLQYKRKFTKSTLQAEYFPGFQIAVDPDSVCGSNWRSTNWLISTPLSGDLGGPLDSLVEGFLTPL